MTTAMGGNTGGGNTAVVKAEKSKLSLALEAKQDTILSLLNKRLDLHYFISTALLHVSENEYTLSVAQKNPGSFVKAVVKAAEFGLGFSRGLAYLVPFKDGLVFIPGYQGLIQVMLRGQPRIHQIKAFCVYENENFLHAEGSEPRLYHEPLETTAERGDMRGAYAIAYYRDGCFPQWSYLPLEALQKRREAAKARNKGKESAAWNDWEAEMYLRAPVRQLFKYTLQTEEGQKIMAYEDELWEYNKPEVVEAAHPGDRTRQLSAKLKVMAAKPESEEAKFGDVLPESEPESEPDSEPEPETEKPPVPGTAAPPQPVLAARPNDTPATGQTKGAILGPSVQALMNKLGKDGLTMPQLRTVAKDCGIRMGVPQSLTEDEAQIILAKLDN